MTNLTTKLLRVVVLIVSGPFWTTPSIRADGEPVVEPVPGLRDFVATSMKAWKVPGMSIAIVKNGKVLSVEGFGMRDVRGHRPVTADTVFAIGSCTKAFTALGCAILHDEEKIDLDAPVVSYLPRFELDDEVATRRMTPRDLLTHRSGLPRHDLMWYGSPLSREQILPRLADLEPAKGFRSEFQYQNLMFMVAGHLVGKVSGSSWEEFTQARILEPLGMRSTSLSIDDAYRSRDHAEPHDEHEGELRVIPFRNIDAIGPAGSINSCGTDMAKWLLFHLGSGNSGDKRIVSRGRFAELHTPQVVLGAPPRDREFLHASYALGWMVEPYRGRLRLHHGGNIDGFSAMVTLLPRDEIGVSVLTNRDKTPLADVVSLRVIDLLLGIPPIDWSARMAVRQFAARAAKKSKAAKDQSRKEGTEPSHELVEYAGIYEHPAYGTLQVSHGKEGLSFEYNGIPAKLEHWHHDTFVIRGSLIDGLKVLFRTEIDGDIGSLSTALEPAVEPIVFERLVDAEFRTPGYLRRFAGKYTLPGQEVSVSLTRTGSLVVDLPGQPRWTLVPTKRNIFTIKELDGFTVSFRLDDDRWSTTVTFVQPNGVFEGERADRKERDF